MMSTKHPMSVTRDDARSHLVQYPKVKLVVIRGPDTGLCFETAGAAVRIGTSPKNDLMLTDETVSRFHCEVTPGGRGLRVRDEGSKNGVVVGNVWISDATFAGAVNLELGETCSSVSPLAETVNREQLDVDRLGDLLGRSPKMRELFADLTRIAPTDISLLIEGETGTGKELVAESRHQSRLRRAGALSGFDCRRVAPPMAESDRFTR